MLKRKKNDGMTSMAVKGKKLSQLLWDFHH